MAERNVSLLEDSVTGLKTSNGIKVPSVTGGVSTDNAIVRFDGTSGEVQNSGVVIDDSGNVIQNGTSYEIRGTNPYLQFSTSAGVENGYIQQIATDMLINVQNAGVLEVRTNNRERMRIDSAGNVGIGITPSAWNSSYRTLDFYNYGGISNGQGNFTFQMNSYRNASGVDIYKLDDYASRYNQISGIHSWQTAPSGTAGNSIPWTNAMTLGANGNLLVGTTTDNGSRLQVSDGNNTLSVSPYLNGIDIASTGNLAPHYITDFTVYKGVPGSGIGNLRIAPITDNLLVGTMTDNGVDKLQVNGSITSKSSSFKYNDLNNACTVDENTIVNNTCLNIPINDYGYVTIQVATPYAYCMQTFVGLNAPARMFIRVLAGGSGWSPWAEK